ncbi:MAG TPA: NAD(P)H-dependent oxidoreductase [Candidatus Acidoferrales bacterium]|nr:NAD(P)H-dependent oxidoreductase [Candidatus Acidoferrales bacterium]
MYKTKPCLDCAMPPKSSPVNVLVLNASLKHRPELSNTEELAQLVVDNMKHHPAGLTSEIIRLSDKKIPVGLGLRQSPEDDWPAITEKIVAADILLFATPIWWGNRASLMQRIIERMDAFDEQYIAGGRSVLYNKVAGIVITGSEDGALSAMGTIMMVLTWLGFTLPPECAAYWVGEVGQPPSKDREKRLANDATQHMAKNLARNLLFYSQLLKMHPLVPKAG